MRLFKDMATKYKERIGDVHRMFNDVGSEVSKIAVEKARRRTKYMKAVDSGNYIGSWGSSVKKRGLDTRVTLFNTADYASHIEFGHKIAKGPRAKKEKNENVEDDKSKLKKTKTKKKKIKVSKNMVVGDKVKGRFIGKHTIIRTRIIAQKMLRNGLGDILR